MMKNTMIFNVIFNKPFKMHLFAQLENLFSLLRTNTRSCNFDIVELMIRKIIKSLVIIKVKY